MIRISKKEMNWLTANGVYIGEGGISHTYTKHHHYYLTESRNNLIKLAKYRDSVTIKKEN